MRPLLHAVLLGLSMIMTSHNKLKDPPPPHVDKMTIVTCVHDKYGYWAFEPDRAFGFSRFSCEDASVIVAHTSPAWHTWFGNTPAKLYAL